jgi:hypothetical protein
VGATHAHTLWAHKPASQSSTACGQGANLRDWHFTCTEGPARGLPSSRLAMLACGISQLGKRVNYCNVFEGVVLSMEWRAWRAEQKTHDYKLCPMSCVLPCRPMQQLERPRVHMVFWNVHGGSSCGRSGCYLLGGPSEGHPQCGESKQWLTKR